jgi:4'-phosphopantetheinyl transferase EntD
VSELADAVTRLASRAGVRGALVLVDGAGRDARSRAGALAAGPTLVGHAEDGRPLWSAGSTGSIAHTDTEAVAVVAAEDRCGALGVDIEVAAALAVDDARLVLAPAEQALVDAHARPDWAATLVWSAKESAFKAWSTATGGGLGTVDPIEIVVTLDEAARSVSVDACGRLGAVVRQLVPSSGFYEEADGRVLTLVLIGRVSG